MTRLPQSVQLAQINFPYSVPPVDPELIKALLEIKQAAAMANAHAKVISADHSHVIVQATQILISSGKYRKLIKMPSLQGGAGTLINFAVNEMIAHECGLLYKQLSIHPHDHINASQSTNDVNPSALRIVCLRLAESLIAALIDSERVLHQQAKTYRGKKKLGRTHIQDAVPMYICDEFQSWKYIFSRHRKNIFTAMINLRELNLGGSAIGNGVNVSKKYISYIYSSLDKITGLELFPSPVMMSLTASSTDFYNLSAAILSLYIDLSKIATDIRFLSSGPKGGVGEIVLPQLQKGSSIMPGKVNPVNPESINQIYYELSAKSSAIEQACRDSNLQLSVMFPTIASNIISMLRLATEGVLNLTTNCLKTMKVDVDRCQQLLDATSAYATLITPFVGYDRASKLVSVWRGQGGSFVDFVKKQNILTNDQLKRISD